MSYESVKSYATYGTLSGTVWSLLFRETIFSSRSAVRGDNGISVEVKVTSHFGETDNPNARLALGCAHISPLSTSTWPTVSTVEGTTDHIQK